MWTFWRSLWVLFLSVSVQSGLGFECNSGTLGLEDLRIQDSQLTAQSYYESLSIGGGKSVDTEPKCARLNKNNCAWCAPRGSGQYLQVDLHGDFNITGIATQGFEALSDYYVKRYIVSHSRNGLKWSTFPVMTGNHDGRSVVRHTFRSPVYARYIRVYPVTYRYRICMRMELYGCTKSSSALSTTPSSTTLSGANNSIPENVPPTTRIKAASSTEKPIASSALSTIPSATTLSGANNETPKNVPPTTRTTAAPSTEKPTTSHSASECNTALGLQDLGIQDLGIQDSQLTAQSYYESLSIGGGISVDTEPRCARLNKNNCAWCAPRGNGQYLQVDLRRDFNITGIATQGFEALSNYYVKRYRVSHSRNGHTWSIFPELMRGNHDGRSVVRHNFISPVYARYIRVYPMTYRYRICMRMELYGCSNPSSALSTTPSPTTNTTPKNVPPTTRTGAASSKEKPMTIHSTTASSALSTTPSPTTLSAGNNIPENVPPTTRTTAASSTEKLMISHSASECNTALGVEDLRINDSQLTAQSNYESLSIGGGKSVDTEPKCARLNHKSCAWCAPRGNGQYLQVDLRGDFTITGIATQGFEALSDYYVRRYKVSHSKDGYTWSTSPVALRGNHDGRSVVRHNFSSPKYARYIRVYPVAYKYRICMRMELYGCSNTSSALSTTPSSTTLSVFNNTISGNLPPTTSATAALSTETSTGQPVGSGEVLTTTSKAEGTQQSGEHALQTGNAATDMVKDSSRKRSSKTVMIALIVVALALVIIICLLVAWLRLRGRKRSYRYSSPKMEVQLL